MLPRASVLHCLLVKVVILLLHSSFPCDELSPAAEYLLTEGGLIQNIYDTATSPNPGSSVACSGLRSFNQNLGDAINRAKKAGIPNQKLLAILSVNNLFIYLLSFFIYIFYNFSRQTTHGQNSKISFIFTT